jgi:hypothetical protein
MERFDYNKVGNIDEYVGCKIDRGDDEKGPYLNITHPVLLKNYHDVFKLPEVQIPTTPAEPGMCWWECKKEIKLIWRHRNIQIWCWHTFAYDEMIKTECIEFQEVDVQQHDGFKSITYEINAANNAVLFDYAQPGYTVVTTWALGWHPGIRIYGIRKWWFMIW